MEVCLLEVQYCLIVSQCFVVTSCSCPERTALKSVHNAHCNQSVSTLSQLDAAEPLMFTENFCSALLFSGSDMTKVSCRSHCFSYVMFQQAQTKTTCSVDLLSLVSAACACRG